MVVADNTNCLLGIGWRPELAWSIEKREDIRFVELLAEHFIDGRKFVIPNSVLKLKNRATVVVHGVSLSLGSADTPDTEYLKRLGQLAHEVGATMVSEHIAFVRGGGLESGHLLPVQKTKETLAVVAENIAIAQEHLPVPLAVENIAACFRYDDNTMTDAEFLSELVERCGCKFLFDASNFYANCVNYGIDLDKELRALPLQSVAYVHIAGGVYQNGFYQDTHAHEVSDPIYQLVEKLLTLATPHAVLLERDDNFSTEAELFRELNKIASCIVNSRPSQNVPVARWRLQPATPRAGMLETQAAIMRALVSDDPSEVANVSSDEIARTRQILLNKRRSILKRTHAFLPAMLGEQFCCAFERYANQPPIKTVLDPRKDARAFALWLVKHEKSLAPKQKTQLMFWILRRSLYCA